ncbi:MAG: DUF6273 domain-containing protein [Lachnospiraceae bacterium]|nr:DUF6273 domain-containing protein [Lachnospiraceae bacterium]
MDTNKKPEESTNLSFANPIYDSNTGAAIWSYIYFGSYPQTEIKGYGLDSAISGAEYGKSGDTYVNGIKYRRISKENTESPDFFGDAPFRYFKWEKIKWRVLWNNGKTLFIAAEKGIDCKPYNDVNESVTWENCTLRQWLNNNFLDMAFSSDEQKAIITSQVQNEPMPSYKAGNGNNTNDKIYLLSIPELRNPAYGLWEEKMDWEHKKDKKMNRRIKPSDYANARGVKICTRKDTMALATRKAIGRCSYWLRSRCSYTHYGAEVVESGEVFTVGYYNHRQIKQKAVVPVMHIGLKELADILQPCQ